MHNGEKYIYITLVLIQQKQIDRYIFSFVLSVFINKCTDAVYTRLRVQIDIGSSTTAGLSTQEDLTLTKAINSN